MALTYDELRNDYKEFIYEGFTTDVVDNRLRVVYHFNVPGLSEFNPTLSFPLDHTLVINDAKSNFAQGVLFAIGMVELISYWKIACPPKVIVRAGFVSDEQVVWWKKLYFNGLGEFFYQNDINPEFEDFMEIISEGEEVTKFTNDFKTSGLNLIPVGGGKDSIVTLEHLSSIKEKNVTFGMNPTIASLDTMEIARYGEDKRFIVSRTLDKNMIRLNSEGFLNGHTPFSALLAFVSYFVSYLIGAEYIVLSNEASANAASIPGTNINHQYSKTSEFEIAFQEYTKNYLSENIFYFSLLRPFAEVAIARSFVDYEQHFATFRSCNVGSKKNVWCGNCSKCMFIFAMLAAFLSEERLVEIFGANLWENEELLEDWEKLLGVIEQKPFECVGTVEEVQFAAVIIINNYLENNKELPLLLESAFNSAKNGDLREVFFDEKNNRLESLAIENPLEVWELDERVPSQFKQYIADIVDEGKIYAK